MPKFTFFSNKAKLCKDFPDSDVIGEKIELLLNYLQLYVLAEVHKLVLSKQATKQDGVNTQFYRGKCATRYLTMCVL